MSETGQLVRAKSILGLSVVNHGGSIYLKIPKSMNDLLRLSAGDNVQVAYMGKLYPEPKRPDPEEERQA